LAIFDSGRAIMVKIDVSDYTIEIYIS
jgi:hypothetical protein